MIFYIITVSDVYTISYENIRTELLERIYTKNEYTNTGRENLTYDLNYSYEITIASEKLREICTGICTMKIND